MYSVSNCYLDHDKMYNSVKQSSTYSFLSDATKWCAPMILQSGNESKNFGLICKCQLYRILRWHSMVDKVNFSHSMILYDHILLSSVSDFLMLDTVKFHSWVRLMVAESWTHGTVEPYTRTKCPSTVTTFSIVV